MLLELRVENLLLIERADLALAPGLNVLTGETGAGKTVLAHALDLLLGGRPRAQIVRPGATEAYVEGVFELPDDLGDDVRERLGAGSETLILARRVGADGRTRAYLNGRAANVGELRDLAAGLISFYGQHEHRRLTVASSQMGILDASCGPEQPLRQAACADVHARVHELERMASELADLAGARERELDLLAFELAEIEQAGPTAVEYEELLAERARLRHVQALGSASGEAAHALQGASDGGDAGHAGAIASVTAGVRQLEAPAGVDPALDSLAERLRALAIEADDVGADLRRYSEGLEAEPNRLQAVEERLEVLERLMRKHGGSIADVLAHAEHCRARRDLLLDAASALQRSDRDLAQARRELDQVAEALRAARRVAAPRLSAAVCERLAGLAMEGAVFEVSLSERPVGPTGADGVDFTIAPNPGVPAGPLREIASGGELSRVMLAIMGVASSGGSGTVVFDEVDAGIGGHTARAVGEQLHQLAADRQVICITHLPQVAALADRHFSIAKDSSVEPALTTVTQLDEAAADSELVRMLGSTGDEAGARRHARSLRRAA